MKKKLRISLIITVLQRRPQGFMGLQKKLQFYKEGERIYGRNKTIPIL